MLNFKLGELFCGPGGMAIGAKIAAEDFAKENNVNLPIDHLWGVDIDSAAIDTYSRNLNGEGVCTEATLFTQPDRLSKEKQISDFERISALAFGFPCNDFSRVGEQRGIKGEFGNLYKAGINAINFSNPLFFIAENVSGIHSANDFVAFQNILFDLEESGENGYNLTTHLYKFEEYGIPQARHRYIIVGIRKDLDLKFRVPTPTTPDKFVSAKEVLKRPYKFKYNTNYKGHSDQVIWRLIFTPPGVNAWKLDEIINYNDFELEKYLKSELPWYKSKIKPLGNIEAIREKIEYCRLHCTKAKMSHIYKRLNPEKPAYTVTGSGGGGTHMYHWSEHRALTNRERARLQSFPDDFEFKGSSEKVRKQIGMAVPPEGAKIIFNAILNTFAGIEYSFVDHSYNPLSKEEVKSHHYKNIRSQVSKYFKEKYGVSVTTFEVQKENYEDWINRKLSYKEMAFLIFNSHNKKIARPQTKSQKFSA